MLDGKRILVTGGTGSFGNAFVEQVLQGFEPDRIVVYSRDEFKQDRMQKKFNHDHRLRFFIGDVRDEDRLSFAMENVDIVFHAAAMKQVVASEYNPIECIKTNILGAENVIRVAIRKNVPKVVAVSTDKAVKPINLYGSSKACMEKLFIAANHLAGASGTRFCNVRYGNVIGSRGSVIPVFLEQRKTGKLTITDERMTRFWLRIEDGVRFVIDSASRMRGGEVFIKKVPSMRIMDLAAAIAPDCEYENVGIRPGEKLHEAMVSEEESFNTREYSDFYAVLPQIKLWTDEDNYVYNGEEGKPVEDFFAYESGTNTDWLSVDDLLELIGQTNIVSE